MTNFKQTKNKSKQRNKILIYFEMRENKHAEEKVDFDSGAL
jgi:hypothetical protein